MIGKLVKYEIKSSIKLMCVIWTALILVSILFSISIHVLSGNAELAGNSAFNTVTGIIEVVTGFMCFAVFTALIVVTLGIVIMRFYKGLLGDEGYLMHTLPVKPWQLMTGKGIVAACVIAISIAVSVISMLILLGSESFSLMHELARGIGWIWELEPKFTIFVVEGIILLILYMLKSIYHIYAALAIGQLAGKHRILLSLAAYIGISVALTLISVIVTIIADNVGFIEQLSRFVIVANDQVSNNYTFNTGQLWVLAIFLGGAIQLAAFHVITERILSRNLNLQ